MKLQRAIEKIASFNRTDWVNAQAADVSKKTAEDLEAHGFVQLRQEQTGLRRALLVRLTDSGRGELMAPEEPPQATRYVVEPRCTVSVAPATTVAPTPTSETMEAAIRQVVFDIAQAMRNGDLETANPVEMRSARELADAIARRRWWPR